MQLVTTSCNQCEQNNHTRCPAENLVRQGFINNAGDHCYCAYQDHPTPQSTVQQPKIKSMLGKQNTERDIATNRVVENEVEDD